MISKFGERLRELREERKISQPALADKAGVSGSSISLWENNKRRPTDENIILICKFFGCSADYILGLED